MNRSRAVRMAVPAVAAVALAGAGAWALRPAAAPRLGEDVVTTAAYHTFDGCPALLGYLRTQARPLVGGYGLEGQGSFGPPVAMAVPGPAGETAIRSAASEPGATSSTGTNVQVAGVDEADVSKRSGDLVLTLGGGRDGLTVLRTSGGSAQVAGRLATSWSPTGLLVDGHTVVLVGPAPDGTDGASGTRSISPPGPVPPPVLVVTPRTRIAEVDIADPAHPRLVRTLDVDGSSAGARLSDGVLRLALSASPTRLRLVQPSPTAHASVAAAVAAAKARNLAVVAGSTADQWLPRYTLTPAGGTASSGTVLNCSSIGVPTRFSGLGTVALLTFDLRTQGIARWHGAGVVAGATTLYATGDRTYVATTAWQRQIGPIRAGDVVAEPVPAQEPARTDIHAFATDGGGVHYLGSGEVQGSLLDQYALDEYQGVLRVATTTAPAWEGGVMMPMTGGPAPAVSSSSATVRPGPAAGSSAVTDLRLHDGRLEQVGRVAGLGRGETIHAVRFAGPVGYVVTFRQTDPLYTLDLADPAHPRVAGQLALLGYSAYLHPLGDGLLLGVGRDAAADGNTSGVLMSLFDVADPAHPRLLDRITVPDTWSGVEADPHAFTYADGTAMVPLPDGVLAVPVQGRSFGTPSILQLQRGGIVDSIDPSQVRTFADPSTLWTVAPGSDGGLLTAHDAHDLTWLSSVRF